MERDFLDPFCSPFALREKGVGGMRAKQAHFSNGF
jgi:hypothetical protein